MQNIKNIFQRLKLLFFVILFYLFIFFKWVKVRLGIVAILLIHQPFFNPQFPVPPLINTVRAPGLQDTFNCT